MGNLNEIMKSNETKPAANAQGGKVTRKNSRMATDACVYVCMYACMYGMYVRMY